MSRRTRNSRNRSVVVLDNDNDNDDSCIDLTEEDGSVVDLTSSQTNNGVNDSSVVVIESVSETPPSNSRRRRNRFADISFDNDDDLPPAPFSISPPVRSSRSTGETFQSPEPIKITCPVCLDDDKTIKKGKKKLASTVCGHVFCSECIYDCIQSQRCCPVCRKRLHHKQVHLLHI